ncbi:hypothetical protein BI313_08735 [Xanthomonas vesicatoria]|nr:hypothetical protein BI313_08735 [Xanthomonas vesicatoria]
MRHCPPPVRQLKIFYPPTPLPASHKQKCANLLRRSIAMHAHLRIAERMSHDADRSSTDLARIDFFHRAHARSSRATHVRNPTQGHSGDVAAISGAWASLRTSHHVIANRLTGAQPSARTDATQSSIPSRSCASTKTASAIARPKKWPLWERPSVSSREQRLSGRRLPAARHSRRATAGR